MGLQGYYLQKECGRGGAHLQANALLNTRRLTPSRIKRVGAGFALVGKGWGNRIIRRGLVWEMIRVGRRGYWVCSVRQLKSGLGWGIKVDIGSGHWTVKSGHWER